MKPLVIAVAGTTEVTEHSDPRKQYGMLSIATRQLDPNYFDIVFLPYPARYGDGMSYEYSRSVGMSRLMDKIMGHGETSPIYILGYSQGAAIVTLVVKSLRRGVASGVLRQETLDNIKGIYLIANPHRQPGMIVGPDPGGEGIAFNALADGWWGEVKSRVMEFCAPGDIIGSSNPDTTLLKRLAPYTEKMNYADLSGWAASVANTMSRTNPLKMFPELRRQFGFLNYLGRYGRTINALLFYVSSFVHEHYNTYFIDGKFVMEIIVDDIVEKAVNVA